MSANRQDKEHNEQAKFFAVLRLLAKKDSRLEWAHAIPNGFLRTKSMRIRAWSEGVTSGISDVFIPFPSNGFHGLYIEFKSPTGTLSKPQAEFLDCMASRGFKTQVARSCQEALVALRDYLEPGKSDEPEGI